MRKIRKKEKHEKGACFHATCSSPSYITRSFIISPLPPTDWESENATELLAMYNYTGPFKAELSPTALRLNRLYIRVYILWMNLLLLILGPFIVIIILNFKVVAKRVSSFGWPTHSLPFLPGSTFISREEGLLA